MATVRLQTPSRPGREITKVSGSKVLVGDVELEHVSDVRLVGEPGELWKLQITVMVDPAHLFQPAERVEVSFHVGGETTAEMVKDAMGRHTCVVSR